MGLWVRERGFYKRFFWLTLIIGMQNLISVGVNLSDNVMLGGYSESALSGVALATQIQFLLHMLVMGVCEGLVIMSSRFWGAKDMDSIKKSASIGMRLTIALSLVMWAVIFFLPHEVLSIFTKDANVIAAGAEYLSIICFSYVFFAITSSLLATLRSVETVKIGFVVSLSTLIINIILNYILIYGYLGFPELGVAGSAIATLTARVIECVIVILYIKRFDRKIMLKLQDFLQFDAALFKQYIRVARRF
ncbi:MATE family efflux transporter [Paenibacillus sp. JCM 10914]|uniref:MATE family efflux transporter n=1 Tax=Paenibacillus sp. JCM 10914 TaxID=1236974 RepID=UPI0003CCBB21|nr:MATE family efflux transporter [Paenibacillus sp. JCM 10914]GAE07165.1 Na++ driven multidrug efflux pump [Paenibacillus sp. JCM 10914]